MEEAITQIEEKENKEESAEQLNNRPWLFKKGKSGNPSGRPKGSISLKQKASEYLRGLSDEEIYEYFNGLNKLDIWKMAEGNPESKVEVETKEDPYANLTREQKIEQFRANLRRLEAAGDITGTNGLNIPDGSGPELSKDGQGTQGSGNIPQVCEGKCEASSNTSTKITPENNRDNNIVDNTATDKQSESQNIPS